MSDRPAGGGAAPAGRALPWLAAAVVFAGLVAVTVSDWCWFQAKAVFPWMLWPRFHDWRVVQIGWDAQAAGLDPLAMPGHPYNYPRLLLLGSDFGLQHLPAEFVGLAAAACALAALAFLLGRAGRVAAAAGAVLMMSPPVLLLLERGNLDAWIVVLLVTGLFALTRESRPGAQAAGVAALVLAAGLKLYPVAVMAGGVAGWRDARRKWLALTLGVLAVTFFLNRDELGLIFQKTGRGLEPGYGWAIAGSRYFLDAAAAGHPAERGSGAVVRVMHASLGLYVVLLAVAATVGWRARHRLPAGGDPLVRAGFWAGALIYAGSFALGANWSYRLVFLLLCVPGLGEALREPKLRLWARATFALLAVTMFAPFHLPVGWYYPVQACGWLLAGQLFCGAVAVLCRPVSATVT